MYCWHCGSQLSLQATYCTFCKTDQRHNPTPGSPTVYCYHCGRQMPMGATYCVGCGRDQSAHRPPGLASAPVWTARPATSFSPASLPGAFQSSTVPNRIAGLLGIAAATMVIVGSFGPWVTATVVFFGSMNVSGMDGDGKLTLIGGIVAAVLLAIQLFAKPHSLGFALIAALVFVIVGIAGVADWQNVNDKIGGLYDDSALVARVGWGLQAVTIGGFAGAAAAVAHALVTWNHPSNG